MSKSRSLKGTIKGDTNDYIIYQEIEGMCAPIDKMFKEMELVDIKIENFFPYVQKIDQSYGYFLKQPNDTYKPLSQTNWRAILHGQISNLRPKENMPDNNRISVFDKLSQKNIEICYWPDVHYETQKKTLTKKKQKNSEASSTINNPTLKKKRKVSAKKQIIPVNTSKASFSFLIENALKNTSFDFLVKEQIIMDDKEQDIIKKSYDEILVENFEDLFPITKKRKSREESTNKKDIEKRKRKKQKTDFNCDK